MVKSKPRHKRFARLVFCICVSATLVACSQQELYGQLSERQANEMVAVLRNAGVDANKRRAPEAGRFSLQVPASSFSRSVQLLHGAGYPRETNDTLGAVFKKDGFVTTQLEERARFMHALSQELATTLQSIDGVVLARVHLSVPEKRHFADKPQASAASVFIKHRPGMDLAPHIGSIKSLVVNAIEGLPYESVTVVAFAAEPWPGAGGVATTAAATAAGEALNALDTPLWTTASFGGMALLAGGGLWAWQRRRQAAATRTELALRVPA
jgi:type III secretion protein J